MVVLGIDGRSYQVDSGCYTLRETLVPTQSQRQLCRPVAITQMSEDFVKVMPAVGVQLTPGPGYQDMNYSPIADNPLLESAGYEGRRSFYYDRSNVMTQGGNVDYGMKQYVSAVEFRAGPRVNPHLDRIQSGRAKGIVWL